MEGFRDSDPQRSNNNSELLVQIRNLKIKFREYIVLRASHANVYTGLSYKIVLK